MAAINDIATFDLAIRDIVGDLVEWRRHCKEYCERVFPGTPEGFSLDRLKGQGF